MMQAVRKAREAHRQAIELTYDGICTITEHRKNINPTTHLTDYAEVVAWEDRPCKLIFKTLKAAQQTETAANVTQITKLLLAPELVIKAGSKITVTQNGVTTDYTSSGIPAVYATHQEIMLELFERWA